MIIEPDPSGSVASTPNTKRCTKQSSAWNTWLRDFRAGAFAARNWCGRLKMSTSRKQKCGQRWDKNRNCRYTSLHYIFLPPPEICRYLVYYWYCIYSLVHHTAALPAMLSILVFMVISDLQFSGRTIQFSRSRSAPHFIFFILGLIGKYIDDNRVTVQHA